jgi:hypothetical protein
VQHNVRLSLTYLDLDNGEAPAANAKTAALLRTALEPLGPKGPAAAAAA